MTKVIYSYNEEQKFYNKEPFPSQLRMIIIGRSGCEKTKLLFKLLLENYFNLDRLVFVSPSLDQIEYDVIIKSLQKGLSINQIRTIFEQQQHITDINIALDIISNNKNFKPSKLEVTVYEKPDDIPLPQELNPNGHKRILFIIDDCTIINSVKPTQLFVYGRPLNINKIYLSKNILKFHVLLERIVMYLYFLNKILELKYFIFRKVCDQFEKDTKIESFFKMNIKAKMISFCIIKKKVNGMIKLLVLLHLTNLIVLI